MFMFISKRPVHSGRWREGLCKDFFFICVFPCFIGKHIGFPLTFATVGNSVFSFSQPGCTIGYHFMHSAARREGSRSFLKSVRERNRRKAGFFSLTKSCVYIKFKMTSPHTQRWQSRLSADSFFFIVFIYMSGW